MQLTPYKFHVYKQRFFHIKTAVLVPAYISHIRGILFLAETPNKTITRKIGYVSVISNEGHQWLDIPVLENSPISMLDFIDVEVKNKGDLRLEIIYKPLNIQDNNEALNIYNLKMMVKHD